MTLISEFSSVTNPNLGFSGLHVYLRQLNECSPSNTPWALGEVNPLLAIIWRHLLSSVRNSSSGNWSTEPIVMFMQNLLPMPKSCLFLPAPCCGWWHSLAHQLSEGEQHRWEKHVSSSCSWSSLDAQAWLGGRRNHKASKHLPQTQGDVP